MVQLLQASLPSKSQWGSTTASCWPHLQVTGVNQAVRSAWAACLSSGSTLPVGCGLGQPWDGFLAEGVRVSTLNLQWEISCSGRSPWFELLLDKCGLDSVECVQNILQALWHSTAGGGCFSRRRVLLWFVLLLSLPRRDPHLSKWSPPWYPNLLRGEAQSGAGEPAKHPPPHGTKASPPAQERAAAPLPSSAPPCAWREVGLIPSAMKR